MVVEPDSPLATMLAAGEAADAAAFAACAAPDVILHSPITTSFVFRGRQQLQDLMEDVFAVLGDLRYDGDEGTATSRTVHGFATLNGMEVHEVAIVTLDDRGLVTDMELFIRPMPALVGLAAVLGPRVARRRGRVRGAATRALLAPLALATRKGESLGARLARPR
jgi:hypothetical protein